MNTASENTATSGEEARPVPPRYWWLKRLSIAAAVLLLALIALRVWWGWYADRRLQALIAEYRAAGQPVLLEDYSVEPVPDDENAAECYRAAHTALVQSLPQAIDLGDGTQVALAVEILLGHPDVMASHPDEVDKLLKANAKTLGLLREARSRPSINWGYQLTSPMISMLLPSLSTQRALAKLAAVAAQHQHVCGDDCGAVEAVRDGLALGAATDQMEPTLITHLVRNAIDGLMIQTVEDIAAHLSIADVPGGDTEAARAATRAQVQALIAELLDEQSVQDGWRRGMYGERTMVLDTVQAIRQGRLSLWSILGGVAPTLLDRAGAVVVGPMWTLDAIRMMRRTAAVARAGVESNWPAARTHLLPMPERVGIERFPMMLTLMLSASFERALQIHFHTLALRRMAATALAIRLYEVDNGRRPETLDELVPEYLPAVPRDPFAADDRAIGYAPANEPRVLYSVSVDGVDDGGSFALEGSGSVDWDAEDMPFFLDGDRPRSVSPGRRVFPSTPAASQPASTQAVEDDQDVEDDERQDRDRQ